MTQSGESNIAVVGPWRVWPRTEDGYCSCPYCTAAREGRLEPLERDERSEWARRMGSPR